MEEPDEIAPIEAEPRLYAEAWPRFWARLFDIGLLSGVIGFLIGLVFPALAATGWVAGRGGDLAIGIIFLPLVFLVDAAILATFGTTPGKLLAGIRVERIDGNPVGRLAFRRNLGVYIYGLALGIPLLNLIAYWRASNRLEIEGATRWDERLDTLVIERGNDGLRTGLTAFLAIGLNVAAFGFERYADAKQPEWDRNAIVAALPQMNSGLPHFLDEVTRLDRIGYDPAADELHYDYVLIHKDASQVDNAELGDPKAIRQMLAGTYCGPTMRFFRERGIAVRHRFTLGGKPFEEYLLTPSDCRS